MKPFNIDVDYESKAFGLDYCIQLIPSAMETDWLATVFVRFPPGHALYRREITEFDSQDIPSDLTVTFCDYGIVGLMEDHTSWWLGLTFSAATFEDIVKEAETLIRQVNTECSVYKLSGGATIGCPAWEEL